MLILKKSESDFESRKDYLIYVAINFIKKFAPYETAFYDSAECDGSCLVDDIEAEFDVPEDLIEV